MTIIPKQNLTHQESHSFELKPGSNCSIAGIIFEGSSRRSTPKCGANQEVSDTSVILWFENDQVDLSQVRNSIFHSCKAKSLTYRRNVPNVPTVLQLSLAYIW